MPTLIKNVRIVDPSQELDAVGDILLANGRVVACGSISAAQQSEAQASESGAAVQTFDGTGLIACPGWVDMHAHLREPGDEHAETIESGARAAAKGGITTVACLPDTNPPIESESAVEYVRLQSARAKGADVYAIAALTKGLQGESLAELGQLSKAGALAFTDCRPIRDASVLLRGLSYASMFRRPVIDVARDPDLGGGVINSGSVANFTGLPGSPAVAEELAVVRGCLLARETGGHYHVATLSTLGALMRIEGARDEAAVNVSAGVAPFSLLMTDEELRAGYDTRLKLRPPLRTQRDIHGLVYGIKTGIVNCIVSCHAPVTSEAKNVEFELAPFGGSTLEVTLAAAVEALYHRNNVPLATVIRSGSCDPARILGLHTKGSLRPGSDADLVLLDLRETTDVDSRTFVSRSRISPYDGMQFRCQVKMTWVGGRLVHSL